jgi:hypothetical protein
MARGKLIALGLLLSLASCQVPRSEAIQGKVADAVERGIAGGRGSFDHAAWDEILRSYARQEGRRFDYAGLKRSELPRLESYLDALGRADLSSLSRDQLMAFLINAYNAYTVKTILDEMSAEGEYRISSIREIPRVFERKVHRMGGFQLSLDNIEHNLLRPFFRDPRVHFAVNCASVSCPPLRPEAFEADRLDEQLEEATRLALSSPDYLRVEGDRLLVTKILDWYGEDFVKDGWRGAEKDLLSYLRKYADQEVRRFIDSRGSRPSLRFMDYDWGLNKP